MLAYFEDWKDGHSPVTTGRAPWLAGPFVEAMHFIRNTYAAERIARLRKDAGK